MFTPLTEAQLDHGLAAIALAQHLGELPPGPVSRRTLAAYAGLSNATIAKVEALALARAHQAAVALALHPTPQPQPTE